LKRHHVFSNARSIFACTVIGLVATACTNSDDPQLSMCQAVAKQLTSNTISEWGDTNRSDNTRDVVVKVGFTNSSSQAGSLSCAYRKDQTTGTVETAPYKVALNGQAVDGKVLISAGTRASKELLAGTYKNTVAKSQELAAEASIVAGEALRIAKRQLAQH